MAANATKPNLRPPQPQRTLRSWFPPRSTASTASTAASVAASDPELPPPVCVSIIGTAGRDELKVSLQTKSLFASMLARTAAIIRDDFKLDPAQVVLVSGGAAWSDHVAVRLFLARSFPALQVHLPCPWQSGPTPQHRVTTGAWQANPGQLANRCHQAFGRVVEADTLQELEQARVAGATFQAHAGFHARNRVIASSPYLIAFGWAEEAAQLTGGTKHTWNLARASSTSSSSASSVPVTRKVYVSLSSLVPATPVTA